MTHIQLFLSDPQGEAPYLVIGNNKADGVFLSVITEGRKITMSRTDLTNGTVEHCYDGLFWVKYS